MRKVLALCTLAFVLFLAKPSHAYVCGARVN